MIYGEMEFLGIIDIPRISTMIYIDQTKWEQWTIRLTDENMEIDASDHNFEIPLKDIIFVDRPLPHAIVNKIQNSSKHAAVMLIDYKKNATIGIGEVLNSMVLAGKKSDISNLKYLLMSLLGLKVDPILGSMKPEDIRLLCLLASGVNKVDILTPIFDGDDQLLHRTFASIKKKKLVDEYASLTPLGQELVDKVRGVEKRKLGSDIFTKFSELTKVWDYLDEISTSFDMNKIIWKCGDSTLCGNTTTEDVKNFLPVDSIREIRVGMNESMSNMDLIMNLGKDSSIFLRSRDYSIIIAFYGILNKREDVQMRILFCLYLGYKSEFTIMDLLQITPLEYERYYARVADEGLLDKERNELTRKGLDMVYNKIIGDISVLFESSNLTYDSENLKRLEEMKKAYTKKKVLDALQNKTLGKKKQTSECEI